MRADEQLLGDLDWQLVHAREAGRQEDAEPACLIPPELFVIDEPAGRIEQFGDLRPAMLGSEPFGRR